MHIVKIWYLTLQKSEVANLLLVFHNPRWRTPFRTENFCRSNISWTKLECKAICILQASWHCLKRGEWIPYVSLLPNPSLRVELWRNITLPLSEKYSEGIEIVFRKGNSSFKGGASLGVKHVLSLCMNLCKKFPYKMLQYATKYSPQPGVMLLYRFSSFTHKNLLRFCTNLGWSIFVIYHQKIQKYLRNYENAYVQNLQDSKIYNA